jgi:hypothetical protein
MRGPSFFFSKKEIKSFVRSEKKRNTSIAKYSRLELHTHTNTHSHTHALAAAAAAAVVAAEAVTMQQWRRKLRPCHSENS